MATPLPNVPLMTPLQDGSGRLSEAWSKYFLQLNQRVGGSQALSNTELAAIHSDALTTLQSQVAVLINSLNTLRAQVATEFDGLNQGRQL